MRLLMIVLFAAAAWAGYTRLQPRGAYAADNDVLMVRPDVCPISDRRERELKAAGIAYRVITPTTHPRETDKFMRGLIASGRMSGKTPIMQVNGQVLDDNSMKAIRSHLRAAE